jgi:hypothetical protein
MPTRKTLIFIFMKIGNYSVIGQVRKGFRREFPPFCPLGILAFFIFMKNRKLLCPSDW